MTLLPLCGGFSGQNRVSVGVYGEILTGLGISSEARIEISLGQRHEGRIDEHSAGIARLGELARRCLSIARIVCQYEYVKVVAATAWAFGNDLGNTRTGQRLHVDQVRTQS